MAWITPVTDRENTQTRTTYADMNRIANNMAEMGGVPVNTSYTDADIVTLAEWSAIVGFIWSWDHEITSSTRFDNLNRIESAMAAAWSGSLYPADTLYPSETLYPRED